MEEALEIIRHLANCQDGIALTYDDGPNEPYTMRLLEILASHDAQGTFFLLGKYVRHRPAIVREIVRAGHAVGNHSYTHRNLSLLSDAEVRQELEACSKAIADVIGSASHLFRPPFGLLSQGGYRVACELGLRTCSWSVSTGDFETTCAETIVERASRQIDSREKGEIILLHDGGHAAFGTNRSSTLLATEKLLEKYSFRKFVALDW
jgi:peptidoglycan-N-acetylglucosamine deacetylase